MKSLIRLIGICLIVIIWVSCTNDEKKNYSTTRTPSQVTPRPLQEEKVSPTDKDEESEEDQSDEKFPDDTYTATVDYYNPTTGYSATYTLDVEVSDGQVIQIDFPNGGYLDEDHITPADIDENGDANVEGEDGKTYDVHIDT